MTAADKIAEARYLIVKQGLYYRPNAQGYTGIKDEAGRYSLEEARSYSHPNGAEGPRDGMSYVAEADAPDYSAACWEDTKAQHMAGKLAALADLADAQAQQLVLICNGCGTTKTDAEIKVWAAEQPDVRRSCCPERKMRPITRADWDAQAQENARLLAALREVSEAETPNANATVRRMGSIARAALGDTP